MPNLEKNTLIYHITDIENLPSILAEGCLHSEAALKDKTPINIGYSHIKERRLREIRVPCCNNRFVGEFVPFYFCPRSPMLQLVQGNLLNAPAEALVNTVNTEGVMGKGIALQFKKAWPEMFRAYEKACKADEVRLGKMHVFDLGGLSGGPRWLINFPTKGHWRSRSRIEDIEAGLRDLCAVVRELKIHSLAIPPLGCGNGGLDWTQIHPLIERELATLSDVEIQLFPPAGAPTAAEMPNRTEAPKMTIGQSALVLLIKRYLDGLLDPFVSLLEVHKLMYFLKVSGEPLQKLIFQKALYGPYAPMLRHSLSRMEGHLTTGFGEGKDDPKIHIELLPDAAEKAETFLRNHKTTLDNIQRTGAFIAGFEDAYGMELLSSMHWVMATNTNIRDNKTTAIRAVQDWNPRKSDLFKPEHLATAWEHIHSHLDFLPA